MFFSSLMFLSFIVYPVLGDSPNGSIKVVNVGPTIGQYETPSMVFAQQYVYLNWTVSDDDGKAGIKNSTVELSNGIIIAYDSATDTFSKIQDIGNYLTLDGSGSLRTDLNSTAFRLSARVMFNWNYTKGNLDLVSAKVYNDQGASGSGAKTDLFYFENDLIVNSASVDHKRANPNDLLTFTGTLYYEGTTIPPAYGNSALSFDGVDDYVDCGHSSSLAFTEAFTITAWVKPSTLHLGGIVSKLNYSANTGFLLYERAAGYVDFGNNHDDVWMTFSQALTVDNWVFIAITYDKTLSSNNLKGYWNGVFDNQATSTGGLGNVSATDLLIGRYVGGSFNGTIDEVRIYNRALSSTEVNECYRGIYSNESGLVLYLPFDGDTLDYSGQGNYGISYGTTWISGAYVNIDAKVELDGVLKETVDVVNTTNGLFTLPSVMASNKIGNYSYNIYAVTNKNSVKNQTVNVIVDGLKIIGGGVSQSSVYIGEAITVWFKAVYEYDNSTFDGTAGILYLNGSAMKWSIDNQRWEFNLASNETGQKTFRITAFLDTKYNLTYLNDIIGLQTVTVTIQWYYPLISWLTSIPLAVWGGVGIISISIITLVVILRLGIITIESEELMQSTEELERQLNELLPSLAREDGQFILLRRFLYQLLKKNPTPETIEFLQKNLPIIIEDIIEATDKKDDERAKKSESDQ